MDEIQQIQKPQEEVTQNSSELEEKIRTLLAVRRIEETREYIRDIPKMVDDIFAIILDEANAEDCALMLLSQGEFALRAAKKRDGNILIYQTASSSSHHLRIGEGIVGQTAQHGRIVAVPDVVKEKVILSGVWSSGPIGALLCLPLHIEGAPVGAITLTYPQPRAFSDEDERLLTTLANQAVIVLDEVRFFDEWQQFNTALAEEVGRATEKQRNLTLALQREVAERRQAEAELRQREKVLKELNTTLEELVEHLPVGICLLDEEQRLVLANSPGRAYLEVLSEAESGDRISRLGDHALEEVLVPRPDGLSHEVAVEGSVQRIFEVVIRPITQGVMKGRWVLVVQDVTRERQTLERVRQQDRLAAVGQLAAGIAHDFNNLLMVIIGFAELLEARGDIREEARADLRLISSQGYRGAQLIRQILDFSRTSAVRRQQVSLEIFLKEAMKLLGRVLPETIQIIFEVSGDDHIVAADPTQLQQVFMNLAVNAHDAMPEGGRLRVGLSHLRLEQGEPGLGLAPGEWVVWTIADTGTGMTPEVRKHVFEPFFSTKRPDRGTGLGLAQVYGIVKQHGGEIHVNSEMGKGTTFWIYLPRLVREEGSAVLPGDEIQRGLGETILVVEDEAAVLATTTAMLESLNYRVLTAANGQQALEVYEHHRGSIAVVLTDMVMPQMDGRKLFEALQAKAPGLQVVMMTGYPLGGSEESQELQGIAGFLEKPLSLEKLARTVHQALKSC